MNIDITYASLHVTMFFFLTNVNEEPCSLPSPLAHPPTQLRFLPSLWLLTRPPLPSFPVSHSPFLPEKQGSIAQEP